MPDLELTEEELAQKDGKDGRPVYICHQGKIYDVSGSNLWKTGSHMKRHPSGKDLTTDLSSAPHGSEVLERFPQVAILKRTGSAAEEQETFLEPLFKKVPFLRRHPHPMTVHFPIVFMLSTVFFSFLYLVTGDPSLDSTAFHCLACGVIFIPIAMLTGFTSWWVNYMARPIRSVTIKITVSALMLAVSLLTLIWREMAPDVLTKLNGAGLLYLFLIFLLLPMILIIGWHGAKLTFPFERK
jgi:predicted heme/steroid binding protein/uncharacterized membrane protein